MEILWNGSYHAGHKMHLLWGWEWEWELELEDICEGGDLFDQNVPPQQECVQGRDDDLSDLIITRFSWVWTLLYSIYTYTCTWAKDAAG